MKETYEFLHEYHTHGAWDTVHIEDDVFVEMTRERADRLIDLFRSVNTPGTKFVEVGDRHWRFRTQAGTPSRWMDIRLVQNRTDE